MLPWPTVQPVYVQPSALWIPSPEQQVQCLRKGVGLVAGRDLWTVSIGDASRTVTSWAEVVEFAGQHGIRLK